VYASDLLLGDARQITHQNKDCMSPRWSPDGRRLIYTSYFRSGFPDIFVIDTGTGQCSTLVSFKGTNSGGRFSPDGGRVAMVLSGEGSPDIYVGSANGRDIRRLTHTPGVEASPCFSPDGSRLVFTSDQAGRPQLFLMSAGGGAMSRVQTNISGYCAEADWSAAAPNKLVFTAGVGSGYQVAVYDFSLGQSRIVSHGGGDMQEPVWLADGRHVLCTAKAANTRSLWIIDTESGKSIRLSPSGFGPCSQASYLAP
jgi:TolB protein